MVIRLPLEQYEQDALEIVEHVYRGGGWFREPSYFALFLLPVMIFQARRSKWRGLTLSSAALIASTSSLIIVAMVGILGDRLLRRSRNTSTWVLLVMSVSAAWFLVMFFNTSVVASRLFDIASGGGSFAIRVLPFFEYLQEALYFFPSNHRDNFLISLASDGDVWFSSAFYLATLFGVGGLIIFIFGSLYLGVFFFLLFLTLIISTSILSSPFVVYIVVGFYCLKAARTEPQIIPGDYLGNKARKKN